METLTKLDFLFYFLYVKAHKGLFIKRGGKSTLHQIYVEKNNFHYFMALHYHTIYLKATPLPVHKAEL